MDLDLAALPDNVDALHRLVRELASEQASERKALSAAQAEIERLRLVVQKLQRVQFGRRAERLDGDQLELGLEDLGADIARVEELLPALPADRGQAVRERSERPSLPEHLEREEVSLDLDMKACPCCGGALHAIGETVSEMLDWVPARLRVVRIRRPRYGCRACGIIHQAPAPERPIAKGLATPVFWPTSWSASTATTFPSIGNRRSSPVRAWSWTGRPWRTGWAERPGGWSH